MSNSVQATVPAAVTPEQASKLRSVHLYGHSQCFPVCKAALDASKGVTGLSYGSKCGHGTTRFPQLSCALWLQCHPGVLSMPHICYVKDATTSSL